MKIGTVGFLVMSALSVQAAVNVEASANASATQGPQPAFTNAHVRNGVLVPGDNYAGNLGMVIEAGPLGVGVTNATTTVRQDGFSGPETYRSDASASTNLRTGILSARVASTGNTPGGPVDTTGIADARMTERLTFVNTTGGALTLPMSLKVNGTIVPSGPPGIGGQSVVSFLTFTGAAVSPNPLGLVGAPAGFDSLRYFYSNGGPLIDGTWGNYLNPNPVWTVTGNGLNQTMQATLVFLPGITIVDFNNISLNVDCREAPTSCDFTATFAFGILPNGLSFTSESGAFLVLPDTTPPVIASNVSPAPNGAGWNNSPAAVSWNVTDPESPITMQNGCGTSVQSADTAGANSTCSATSTGGTSTKTVTVMLDQTAPTITSSQNPPPVGGSNTTPVTVSFNCADSLSGVASCTAPVQVTTPGVHNITGTAVDAAGNRAAITHTVTILACDASYAISPMSQNFSSAGGTGSVNVSALTGCPWTAMSNASWASITMGSNGTGNGVVNYSVAANAGATRSGTLTIATKTFTINQDGVATQPPADLVITKLGLPLIPTGHKAIYLVSVANLGPGTASNVVITDPLPSGTTFVRAVSGAASCTRTSSGV
jgi:uncharacterized repeat protein (TIGR01451 family)